MQKSFQGNLNNKEFIDFSKDILYTNKLSVVTSCVVYKARDSLELIALHSHFN